MNVGQALFTVRMILFQHGTCLEWRNSHYALSCLIFLNQIDDHNRKPNRQALLEKLADLKYTCRSDIRDRAALERNFREKFETLNRVHFTDSEFHRLLESIITPDVFAAARHLREKNTFERDDGTPLHYTLDNAVMRLSI